MKTNKLVVEEITKNIMTSLIKGRGKNRKYLNENYDYDDDEIEEDGTINPEKYDYPTYKVSIHHNYDSDDYNVHAESEYGALEVFGEYCIENDLRGLYYDEDDIEEIVKEEMEYNEGISREEAYDRVTERYIYVDTPKGICYFDGDYLSVIKLK